jgi:very-short-patch-repair endonuclease
MDVVTHLRRTEPAARASVLIRAGFTRASLRSAVASGALVTIRMGWLALPDAPVDVVTAVLIGGRLGCVSLANHLGLWTPPAELLHVAVPHHSGRALVGAPGAVLHWRSARWRDNPSPLESRADMVRQLAICLEREDAVATIDSALHSGAVSWLEVESALASLPSVLAVIDGAAEGGGESLARCRLGRRGIPVRAQARIDGVGRVDLLVGERLVLEIDGRRWHTDPASFERDRERDLELARLGYRVIRLSYLQVTLDWARVERSILEITTRREHLWPRGQAPMA